MANTPRFGRVEGRRRYVAGFGFNYTCSRVALIEKVREPADTQMIGTLMGIGGEVDARETYPAAMRRKFLQEAGVAWGMWSLFAIIEGSSYRVQCFRSVVQGAHWRRIATVTDERILKISTRSLRSHPLYHDVQWLIPLALDWSPRAVVRIDRRGI